MKHKKQNMTIEQPVPMRKQAYQHLRARIIDQTIEPSSRLVEARIAEQLGISRTPVREALHLLEKDGFIKSIPRVGYMVKRLAWEELEEIFEIRRVNESLACRWVIRKMDAKSLKMLENNLERTEKILEKKVAPEKFLELDEEFHEILVRGAGSNHLFELCQQLRRLMLCYRVASIKTVKTVQAALIGHRRIVQKLKDKDIQGLEEALSEHLNYSKDDILMRTIKENPPKD